MRLIVRRERPHPGAQLRLTDSDGWRNTCFATNTRGPGWTLATLEIRHRQRARAEDRIRGLKDTGMRNLPFHGFAQNQIWLEIVSLAAELLAWTQTLFWDEHEPVRRWEPKRLRLRILAVAGQTTHTAGSDYSDSPEAGTTTASSIPRGPRSASPDHTSPTQRPSTENRRPQRRRPRTPMPEEPHFRPSIRRPVRET